MMSDPIQIEPLGEIAYLLRNLGDWPAYVLAERLSSLEGVEEAAPAYDTVAVHVNPRFELAGLRSALAEAPPREPMQARRHEIPVCYEMGPDLQEVARQLVLGPDEVIAEHCSQSYRCNAIGFSPGFPYLGRLPHRLCGVPRRPSPRPMVPAGSVAITGSQTGVYPSESPGGWALIGRTPLTLVNLEESYFPIRAGDEVRFARISPEEFERRNGERL